MENNVNKKTIVVGISGGVDSAVAAYLLKEQGYDVIGLYMNNWDPVVNQENNYLSTNDECDAQKDYNDALKVANFLKIKLYRKDFIKEYWNNVFKYFIDEYKNNRTPNPDVLCNKNIKFGEFKEYAFKTFKCDYIATGHYARLKFLDNEPKLMLCADQNKDQTYFLCSLSNKQLENVIFPLENLTKTEVRKIAKKIGLPNAEKKDSTGVCFIGERNLVNFLQNYLPHQPGDIVDITNNKVIGKHKGTMYYTIGQRKGLNLGGQKEKYFVCKKDLSKKIIYVAPNSLEDQFLVSNYLEINNFNWISQLKENIPIFARFRHRQALQLVEVTMEFNKVIVKYEKQKNIVTGQYCVLYQNEICLGGGEISHVKKN